MTNAPLSPTAQKVLDLLQQHAGTPYSASDVCELADCSTGVLLRMSGQAALSGPSGTAKDEPRVATVFKPMPSGI